MQPSLSEDRDKNWRDIVHPEVFFLTLLSASLYLFPVTAPQSERCSKAQVTVIKLVTASKNKPV